MSLVLTVDGPRWRAHLQGVVARHPGVVPVAKGNGYGLSLGRLARKATWLGVDTLAVGTYDELGEVANRFDGSLLVLTPWRPFGAALELAPGSPLSRRVIHTVSRVEDLSALLARDPGARFVLERTTSMLRHGMAARELREAGALLAERGGLASQLAGVALHLPLAQGSHVGQVQRLMTDVVAAGLTSTTVWVSHLKDDELAQLGASYPDYTFRPRVGTSLWLGDRGAFTVAAHVLDTHPVERGDVFGYRGRSSPKAGTILVVSGGTAHGIGLEAPSGDLSMKARAATIARGGMDAVGFVRSPFSIDGKQRLFAEPPHMQASMLFVPSGSRVPAVGDTVDVRVRYTATSFDRVVVS
ncbi:alanine racemase [Nocardioides alkalitolerans]|uniref:alanine racemase n=1 Tax=Nocardioides alkalitolerans TaxID=281714 RepID=UPI000400E30C|nr:alanine racemase [Nocardioides alkalitolerans]